MKNISKQYQDLLEGKMNQAQFLRNARMMFPSFVTQHNSFADSVIILKQKGMLNEGDAVKGTPDKEPTYASLTPDDKIKYKKVEQSPEVDEQDGIYPATTITDIPKEKTYKKVKNESDGLEPIKDNDTKNEMKKVKVVKEGIDDYNTPPWDRPRYKGVFDLGDEYDDDDREPFHPYQYLKQEYGSKAKAIENNIFDAEETDNNPNLWDYFMSLESPKEVDEFLQGFMDEELEENQRSFDDIFGDFIETDDSTEIKTYLKTKGKEAITKIKAKLPQLKDAARKKLAKLMKVELDEVKTNRTSFDYKSTFEDLVMKTNTASKSDFGSIKQNWIERVENSKINPDTKKQMLNSIKAINSLLDLQKFASYGLLRYEKMAVRENQVNEVKIAPDAQAVIGLIGKNTMLLNKLKMINNKEELQPVFDFLLTKINQTIAKNTQQVKTATTTSAQNYSKTGGMGSITEKDAPKLESLISKIMNETLSKKSAI